MIISGLNSDLYLINNPIWVDVSAIADDVKYLEITITDRTKSAEVVVYNTLRLYNNGDKAAYNLQEIIKGNFPEPKYVDVLEGGVIYSSYRFLDISFKEVKGQGVYGETQLFTKTFIRGGEESQKSNINLSIGSKLQMAEKIPVWGGYPYAQYSINQSRQVVANKFLGESELEQMILPKGCNPLYVRFLNSKGGYSHWLFESFTKNVSVSSLSNIARRSGSFHLGTKSQYSLTGETRLKRRYYDLMKSLLKSPEVYLYNQYGVTWAKASVGSNEFEENNFEDMQKISVSFNIELNENPSVLW
jgi:hypothetical protein